MYFRLINSTCTIIFISTKCLFLRLVRDVAPLGVLEGLGNAVCGANGLVLLEVGLIVGGRKRSFAQRYVRVLSFRYGCNEPAWNSS